MLHIDIRWWHSGSSLRHCLVIWIEGRWSSFRIAPCKRINRTSSRNGRILSYILIIALFSIFILLLRRYLHIFLTCIFSHSWHLLRHHWKQIMLRTLFLHRLLLFQSSWRQSLWILSILLVIFISLHHLLMINVFLIHHQVFLVLLIFDDLLVW